MEAKLDHPVREEERREFQVAKPLEQPEQLHAPVLKLREDLEGVQGVDDEQLKAVSRALVHLRLQVAQPVPPSLSSRACEERRIEDVEAALGSGGVQTQGLHLPEKAGGAFREGDVQASSPIRDGVARQDEQ